MISPVASGPGETGIEIRGRVDALSVARRLRSEHPQIIAAVLVRLDSALAADVLKILPDDVRNHLILRIATLNAIRPAAMKDLHDVLLFVLTAPQGASQTAFGGIAAAGKIIRQLGHSVEETVMTSLRDHDPDLARAITTRLAAQGTGGNQGSGFGRGPVSGSLTGAAR